MAEQEKLFEIFFPVDVPSIKDGCALMHELAPHVDVLKIGLEMLHHIGTPQIVDIASEYGTKLMVDCKISDIPNTVAGGVAGVAWSDVDYLNLVVGNCQRSAIKGAVKKLEELSDEFEDCGIAVPELIAVTLMTSWSFSDLLEHGILPPPWWSFKDNEEEQTRNIVDLVMNEHKYFAPNNAKFRFAIPDSLSEQASFCTYVALKWGKIAYEAGIRTMLSSPREAPAFKLAFPDSDFVSPGIRPPWAPKDDQKRTMTPGEAYLSGVKKQVIGRPIRIPPDGMSREEAVRLIREDVQKAHDSMQAG